jgi:two-component system chemotaxis response regulator CheB
MPAGFTRGFAERIDRLTPFAAREAEDGDAPIPGAVLVAPGGQHLEFVRESGRVVAQLCSSAPNDKYAPAVDRLFTSAAKQFGRDLLAIVLTGMGDDGREGVRAVKQAGGQVVAESEQTAVVFGMPQQAIRTGVVDAVLPLPEIAAVIESGLATGAQARRGGA